jgi:hypothetical protein
MVIASTAERIGKGFPGPHSESKTRERFLARLTTVIGWVSTGWLRSKWTTHSQSNAAEAQNALASCQTTGKVLSLP